jgi:exopolysaccharide biosynthesis WecB/TagA/CpsF family protein
MTMTLDIIAAQLRNIAAGSAGALHVPPQGPDVRQQAPHMDFLGLPFCLLGLDETVELIVSQCRGPFAYVVTPNAQHVVAAHGQPDGLARIYRTAWLSLCDSQVIRALAALDGLSLPLVTGSDLVPLLLARQNAAPPVERRRILIVGPDAGTERILRARYPNALIDVLPAPARLAQRGDLRLEVAYACLAREWDILLLCVGCPAQEMLAALIGERGRSTGVALCVGASIDFLTGRSVRAPRWLRCLGLEWAYRLAREPGRLWRRYLVDSPKIFRIYLATRRGASPGRTPG